MIPCCAETRRITGGDPGSADVWDLRTVRPVDQTRPFYRLTGLADITKLSWRDTKLDSSLWCLADYCQVIWLKTHC